jgi:hypothetical protein
LCLHICIQKRILFCMSSTIRLRPRTHEALREITELTGQSMQDALSNAVDDFRRKIYLDGLSEDYKALRGAKRSSAAFDAENKIWDRTSNDGLKET